MNRKLVSAALFATLLGSLLVLSPLPGVVQRQGRILGLPADLIYLFVCWALLVAAAFWLSRRLPHEAEAEPRDDETR